MDKPIGVTSAACVARVKRLITAKGDHPKAGPGRVKVGHAGTLDPLAGGVLVVLVGPATRQADRLMADAKGYRAGVRLGATTATDDAEADARPVVGATDPGEPAVRAAMARFVGTIRQRPPAFSAIKVKGRRAYDLARGGKEVRLDDRPVRVDRLELVSYAWPDLVLDMTVGKGFYVRSLARDLGDALGTGGHLTSLRRTFVGDCRLEDAVTLDQLERDGVEPHLRDVPPAAV